MGIREKIRKARDEKQRLEEKERLEKERELKEQKRIVDSLSKICIWPGTKSEFEDFIGYETSWLDLGGRIKGLEYKNNADNPFYFYEYDFQKRIVDSGVVALVDSNFTYSSSSFGGYGDDRVYFGVPVKKKE